MNLGCHPACRPTGLKKATMTPSVSRQLSCAALAVILLAPLAAQASLYASASFNARSSSGGTNSGWAWDPSISAVTWADPRGYGYVQTAPGPTPSLTVVAHADAGDGVHSSETAAAGVFNYSYSVSGPDATIAVPVHISGAWSLSTSGTDASVNAYVDVFGATSYGFHTGCDSWGSTVCGSGTFSGTVSAYAVSNSGYGVQLLIQSHMRGDSGAGSAMGYVDPYISVDPIWAASHPGFSIAVSDGIGNSAPVPEPAARLLMGLGLAGLASLRRRQA